MFYKNVWAIYIESKHLLFDNSSIFKINAHFYGLCDFHPSQPLHNFSHQKNSCLLLLPVLVMLI